MNGPLSGFDYVLEISQPALLRLLQETLTVQDVRMRPPFPLRLPVNAGGQRLTIHLIVEDVQLDVQPANHLRLTLAFARSSIEFGSFGTAIYPLSGTLRIDVQMTLHALGDFRPLALEFGAAQVALDLGGEGRQAIARGAVDAGLTPDTATATLVDAVRGLMRGLGKVLVPTGSMLVPGEDGGLRIGDPPVQRFTRLEVFGIAHQVRSRQSIALFGNLFADTESQGDSGQRVASAISSGSDFLVALSPRAFHSFIFCPALAGALGVPREALPTACGGATGLNHDGVTIKQVVSSLNDDFIGVAARVEKSGTCYEATGVVVAHVRLAVSGGILTSAVTVPVKEFGVTVDWYCQLALISGWSLYGAYLVTWIADTFESIAASNADTQIVNQLGRLAPAAAFAPTGIPIATVPTAATVTASEVTVQSRRRLGFVDPVPAPRLELVHDKSEVVSSFSRPGVFTTRIFCQREAKRYGYIETQQSRRITYELRTWLLPEPLSVTFSVRGRSGDWVPLAPQPAGLPVSPAVVPDVECRFAVPLTTGGSTVEKSVSLRYSLAGRSVRLTSDAKDGNFWVDLRAEVRDPAGQSPPGVDANPVVTVYIEGSSVEMDEEYRADLAQCMKIARDVSDRFSESRRVPPWEQAFDPVARLREEERALRALAPGEGQEMLRDFHNIHAAEIARFTAATQRAELASTGPSNGEDSGELESRIEAAIDNLNLTLAQLRRRQ